MPNKTRPEDFNKSQVMTALELMKIMIEPEHLLYYHTQSSPSIYDHHYDNDNA